MFRISQIGPIPDIKPYVEELTLVKDFVQATVPSSEELKLYRIANRDDGDYMVRIGSPEEAYLLPSDVAEAYAHLEETLLEIDHVPLDYIDVKGDVIQFSSREEARYGFAFSPKGRKPVREMEEYAIVVKRLMRNWYYFN
ncbi:MAG: hypothetical protein IIV79_03325 [Clostridia bacterium]|nr:hypothetical protein [Clostridia bacterium]